MAQSRIGRICGILTPRGQAVVAAGLTFLVCGLLLGFTDIIRVGVFGAALPVLAALSARRNGSSIVVTRTVRPARLVVGQTASVTAALRNSSGRRTQLQLGEEHLPQVLGNRARFVLPAMEPGDIREVSYELACQVRGLYRLGPLRLSKEDPYGLATTTSLVPGHTDLLILPRVESLGSGRPGASGVGAGSSYSPLLASPDEDDVAVRSFRDGDDLRRIHWPSTAHRSRLMVRQEDHPARRRAVIVVDSREAGHQGSGLTGSFEWSVTAAASIAVHLAEHQYLVHLASGEAAVNGQMRQTVEIDDAVALLALAQLGPSQQYEEVLRSAGQLTPGALVVAIVTDHDEKALRRTAALRPPEGTGLLILLDTASFARPPGAAPTGQTLALAAMFASAGWSTCVVGAGMPVAQAWSIVSSRNPVIDRAAAR